MGKVWYWLAGAILAYVGVLIYLAIVNPVLPALAWHRTHSRKMQFVEFHLDVPLLWSVPKADFQQPEEITIEKAVLPGRGFSLISLSRHSSWAHSGSDHIDTEAMRQMQDEDWKHEEKFWAKTFGASNTTRTTYPLAAGSMDCLYQESGSFVTMLCFNKKTGSSLDFIGTKRDYSKLHDIVR